MKALLIALGLPNVFRKLEHGVQRSKREYFRIVHWSKIITQNKGDDHKVYKYKKYWKHTTYLHVFPAPQMFSNQAPPPLGQNKISRVRDESCLLSVLLIYVRASIRQRDHGEHPHVRETIDIVGLRYGFLLDSNRRNARLYGTPLML